ncbi:MAG: mandelate racemase/muconate lactonizing enzyme family protein, partial [Acidobacteriia bacterium]|nr:mandelate racemase/muconate lactonizing enzyme family protein [Terriglobia bacterium]
MRRTRREFFRAAGAGLLAPAAIEAAQGDVRTASRPSELKITDLRVADIGTIALIRLDTNQGISGYGETYTSSSKIYPLFLKSRLLGENPCNIDKLFRKIKQFGFHARQASGVTAVEMALWDLAGKAYGIPVYQL